MPATRRRPDLFAIFVATFVVSAIVAELVLIAWLFTP
jgi:hypothetical protein